MAVRGIGTRTAAAMIPKPTFSYVLLVPRFLTFAEARSRATQMALSRPDFADRVPCAAPPT